MIQRDKQLQQLNTTDMVSLLEWCKPIAQSEFSPHRRAEDVAACVVWAQEHKVSFIDALNHLHIIEGPNGNRVSPDVHLIKAQMLKHGLYHEYVKDYEPVYSYITKDGTSYNEEYFEANFDRFQVVTGTTDPSTIDKSKILVKRTIIDYITVCQIKRAVQLGDQTHIMTYTGSFSWKDAQQAELHERKVYLRYPKRMLRHRSYTIAANEAGADILYTTSANEIYDEMGVDYEMTEEGAISVLDPNVEVTAEEAEATDITT
jgi:hypothetical protein